MDVSEHEARTPSAGASRRVDWRRWLAGGSPREILARIVRDDPLGVRLRVAARLRAEARLLDADRVHLRSLARCARAAARYRGRPGLDEWLDGIVAEAIVELVREDREDRQAGREPDGDQSDRLRAFSELARPIGLDARAMHGACSLFNELEAADRGAFFALVIEGGDLDQRARALATTPTALARRARKALEIVLAVPTETGREDATNTKDEEPS